MFCFALSITKALCDLLEVLVMHFSLKYQHTYSWVMLMYWYALHMCEEVYCDPYLCILLRLIVAWH